MRGRVGVRWREGRVQLEFGQKHWGLEFTG